MCRRGEAVARAHLREGVVVAELERGGGLLARCERAVGVVERGGERGGR